VCVCVCVYVHVTHLHLRDNAKIERSYIFALLVRIYDVDRGNFTCSILQWDMVVKKYEETINLNDY